MITRLLSLDPSLSPVPAPSLINDLRANQTYAGPSSGCDEDSEREQGARSLDFSTADLLAV